MVAFISIDCTFLVIKQIASYWTRWRKSAVYLVLWWWCQISVWVILKTPKLFVYFLLTAEALHPCSSGDVLHRAAGAGARCARRHQRRTVRCSQPPKPGQEERTWAAIAMVTSHQRSEGGWGDQTRQRTAERSAGSRWVKNVLGEKMTMRGMVDVILLYFSSVCVRLDFFFLPSDSSLNHSLILVLQCKGMRACGEFLWLKAGMCMTFTALLSHD